MNRLKNLFYLSALFLFIFAGAASASDKKTIVICSLFPQYDFVREIAGDTVELEMLLPPGTDSHSFDPRPSDMLKLNNADIFVYTGKYMEPWAERIVAGLDNKRLKVLDASQGITLSKGHHHDDDDDDNDIVDDHDECDDEDCHHCSHGHSFDPHIWLDLSLAVKMVDSITATLIECSPENADIYRKNSEEYKAKLIELDNEIAGIVARGKRRSLVFGGHFAYLYFLKHYNLNYVTAYDTCSSEGEPGVKRISQIIHYIKERKIPCIYHEEFAVPKVARSIAEQTGIELLELSTAHNLTRQEFESGVTFLDIMRKNRDNVKRGLE